MNLGEKPKDLIKFFLHTCSITEIAFDAEGHARLVRLNDTSHLNGKLWR